MPSMLARTASAVGRGLAAGLVGTAAMTVSSTVEARLRDRGASDTPAEAAATVLGADGFESSEARQRANQLAHWGYGTSLGAIRGVLDAVGLRPRVADAAFYATVYGAEQAMLPALDLAPPATHWGASEVATDLTHHAVYSAATNAAYRLLSRSAAA